MACAPPAASIVHGRHPIEDPHVDSYLRSHIVSSRIEDAHAAAARRRLVARGAPTSAVAAEPLVGRIVGVLRTRLPDRPLTPGIHPR
jgi:hypothetical protein